MSIFEEKRAIETLMRAVVSFGDHCHLTIFSNYPTHGILLIYTFKHYFIVCYVQIIYLLDYIYSYVFERKHFRCYHK